ncbi:metal ion binding protein [Galdieria sulphuraria]|uniref:Metal ion binding protein n=1 Tax=Galdieria sulphuraria TaxID=130081 RepID=M2X7H1_GALSU|nr:metal ion binding protein [Galdieria sulphuraria]EME32470.1 metal ion binding protein [Galdieria sulphuraria]|eukprot:XP_005708990.1 metal ion binding protein [Galdieria sulphuraria]
MSLIDLSESSDVLSSRNNNDNSEKGEHNKGFPADSMNFSTTIPEESVNGQCLTCFEHEANIRLLPCGHQILCGVCLTYLSDERCPICREKVESVEIFTQFHQDFTSDLEKRERERELSSGEEERTLSKQEISLREESFSGLLLSQNYSLSPSNGETSRSLSFRDVSLRRKQPHSRKKRQRELAPKPPKVVVSLSNILEECKTLEKEVIDRIFQVLLTGSDYVDKNSIVHSLQDLFPLREKWDPWPERQRQDMIKEEYGNGVDISVPARQFFPNMEIQNIPVHLLSVNLWELLRIVRSGKDDLRYPDVVLVACYTKSLRSLREMLALDEVLRDRLHCKVPRFWVILGGEDAIDEVDAFTLEDVQQAYLAIPSNKRPNDFWYIPSRAAFQTWYEKIGQEIVTFAQTGRQMKTSTELQETNSEEQQDVSCMDCLCL